jgi:hypothetical protein
VCGARFSSSALPRSALRIRTRPQAQFLKARVGNLEHGVELVERLDEKRAAAARGIEDAHGLQLVLPRFPKPDERLALRLVQRGEVVAVRIGEHFGRGAFGFGLPCVGFVALAEGFEA